MTTHDLEVDGARWLVVRGLSVPANATNSWWVYFAATGGPSQTFVEFRVAAADADTEVPLEAMRQALGQVLASQRS